MLGELMPLLGDRTSHGGVELHYVAVVRLRSACSGSIRTAWKVNDRAVWEHANSAASFEYADRLGVECVRALDRARGDRCTPLRRDVIKQFLVSRMIADGLHLLFLGVPGTVLQQRHFRQGC